MAEKMSDLEAVDGFCTYLQGSLGRRPRTVEAYRMSLAKLQEFQQGEPLLEITPEALEAFCGIWLHKRGVVARSRKPYISAVKGFYDWAQLRGQRTDNPAAELRHPKTAKPLPEQLSLANAERLMWAPDLNTLAGIRDASILALLIGCGLRVSGLVSLNESDLRNAEISGAVRLVVRVIEKGEKERQLPVPKEAEMLLRIYLDHEGLRGFDRDIEAAGRPDKVLFVNLRNTRVPADEYRGEAVRISRQAVWRMMQAYGEAAGIPAHERHPHAIRHLFGVELSEDGVDVIMRQELLGHADPKSTGIYDSMVIRRKTKALDQSGPLGKIKSPVSEVLKRL
ncbi:tyrosine-type recombinase/integrase [Paucibacter sp. Y2R2-4]|uniref:tyrosine-type recombinase/integrase n=1 Tax=Paucibacter sp. Y2R2-4 TaxID=2893553 RepID=UPI0021E50AF2|nr:tyrosine-type recombinase/integrase [Paucibacter sp. Y2R2-4]MCV2349294.1 tyrosine-type recombinase/integrase [Paucibacter sp. Y2R2-4]